VSVLGKLKNSSFAPDLFRPNLTQSGVLAHENNVYFHKYWISSEYGNRAIIIRDVVVRALQFPIKPAPRIIMKSINESMRALAKSRPALFLSLSLSLEEVADLSGGDFSPGMRRREEEDNIRETFAHATIRDLPKA